MSSIREDIELSLELLLSELEEKSEDSHEIYQKLAALLGQMRAFGMVLPADLVALEANLAKEFAGQEPTIPADADKSS